MTLAERRRARRQELNAFRKAVVSTWNAGRSAKATARAHGITLFSAQYIISAARRKGWEVRAVKKIGEIRHASQLQALAQAGLSNQAIAAYLGIGSMAFHSTVYRMRRAGMEIPGRSAGDPHR